MEEEPRIEGRYKEEARAMPEEANDGKNARGTTYKALNMRETWAIWTKHHGAY